MSNFSNEAINKVVKIIGDSRNEIESLKQEFAEMSAEDAAQQILIRKYQLTQIEAEEIVNDLKNGISEFDSQMPKSDSDEKMNVSEKLEQLTKEMSEEKRHDYYANVLTTLQFAVSNGQNPREIEQKLEENKQLSNEEIAVKIDELMEDGISLDSITKFIQEGGNKDTISQLASKLRMRKDDFRLFTALWIYSAQHDGEFKGLTDSEINLPAEAIGTLAAAGIETILTTDDLMNGKINLTKWQFIVKCILGTLLCVGILFVSLALMAVAGVAIMALFLMLFGLNWFMFGASILLVLSLAVWLSEASEPYLEKVLDWCSGIYDKYIVVITDKVKSLLAIVKAKMQKTENTQKGEVNITPETQAEEGSQTTQQEPEVQVQPATA